MHTDPDVEARILTFFNQARSPEAIMARIHDDPGRHPERTRAYGIRRTLATRIMATRETLPDKRFDSLEQLDAIFWIGTDTYHDILYSFAQAPQPCTPGAGGVPAWRRRVGRVGEPDRHYARCGKLADACAHTCWWHDDTDGAQRCESRCWLVMNQL